MAVSPKNLLVLLSDNHSRDVMGCAGHEWVRTPNLDRLASEGVLFESAYTASPICCPARATLATGRYPHETGYWDNVLAYDGRAASWMHRARDAGSKAVSVGKLHYRGGDDYGFDQEILPMHLHAGKGAVRNLLRGYNAEPEKPDTAWFDMYAVRSREGATRYQDYDRDITGAARNWLHDRGRGADRPWILLVSWVSPHPPFEVPRKYLDLYPVEQMPLPPGWRGEGWADHPAYRHVRRLERVPDMLDPAMLRRVAAAYFGLVSHLDEQVGEVLAELERLDLRDDTRIIYTSDHGELFGAHGLFGKRSFYEASAGVPLIVAGADVPVGQRHTDHVSHVDLFPTVLECVGARPAPTDQDMAGKSLWQTAQGSAATGRAVFAEYHAHGSATGAFMVRQHNWKLIHHVGMPAQLYDLDADPDEQCDLADRADFADVQARLYGLLRAWCDPEAVDARAKADQVARIEALGGADVARSGDVILYSPVPGDELASR